MNSSFDLMITGPDGTPTFPDWVFENTNEDGEANDQDIATFVKPLEKIILTDKYVRVICDDDGHNTETRIPLKECIVALDEWRSKR